MNMNNEKSQIQEKLRKWAEETVKVYNPIANSLGYYTQSVLDRETLDPDLLILGINPGAAGGGIMTGEELLQGNPCFRGKGDEEVLFDLYKRHDPQKRKYGWDLTNKVNKMLEYAGKQTLHNLDKFVLSNMVFIGTANQEQILLNNEQQIECAKQTLDLIDILNPKVVLLLGDKTKDLFKKVAKISHMEELIPNYHVFYCFYNNIHVISIYHTAYYRFFTNENMKVIGNILGYALDNSMDRIDIQEIKSFIEKRMQMGTYCEVDEQTKKLTGRTRELRGMIKHDGARRKIIYNGTILYYDYFTIEAGKYVNSERNLSIELMPEEDKNQYVILVFTRQHDADETKAIIKGVWPDVKFMPWACDKSRHVVETISFKETNEIIAEKMMQVLRDVKDYRDKSLK